MATETIKLQVDNSGALRGINQVAKEVEGLNSKLAGLRTVLGGLAIGNFIRQTLQFADSVDDLSKATGIATATILGFGQAVRQNGGDSESAQAALNKLVLSIGEAADGSLAAQNAFREVGVSLEDLRNLSEQDIFLKAISGIAKIQDVSRRATIQNELFGKSLRGVDIRGVASNLQGAITQSEKYSESIAKAAAVQQQLEDATLKLQLAFLEVITPLAEFLNNITASTEQLKKFIEIALALGAALATLLILGRLRLLVNAVIGAFNIFARILGFAGVRGKEFVNVVREIITAVAAAGAGLASYFGMTNRSLSPEESANVIDEMNKKSAESHAAANRAAEARLQAEREVQDALAKSITAIKKVGETYKRQTAEQISKLNIDRISLDMSEDEIAVMEAVNEVYERNEEAIRGLIEQRNNLTKEQGALRSVINGQIAAIEKSIEADKKAVTEAVNGINIRKQAQRDLVREIELTNAALQTEYEIGILNEQIALIGLYGDELQIQQSILNITQDLRQKLIDIEKQQNELLKERTRLGEEEFQKQMQHFEALKQKAYEYAGARVDAENRVIEAQKAAQQDWQGTLKQQLEDLADSITPAKLATDLFGATIRGIDDALTQFVEKGKFSFKDFARSLLRDMALIVARALVMRAILGLVGMVFPGAATGLSALMNATPMRAGGPVSASNKYLVGEMGPELFVPRTAGTIIPNNQLAMAGGGNNVTYNINAVDAQSFRNLVARDPQFIFNVTEVGRRSSPARRLA